MKALSIVILSAGLVVPTITAGCKRVTFGGESGKKYASGESNKQPQPGDADASGKKGDSVKVGPESDPTPNTGKNSTDGFATSDTDGIPSAPEPMYATTSTTLYSVNPLNGVATIIGQFDVSTKIWDIAIDGKGKMFAVDATTLYAVNPLTAQLTKIMDHGVSPINALTVLSNGSMVLAGNGVYLIDNATRTLHTLVPPGTYTSSGDVIALPDRKLYWATKQDHSDDQLLVVNPDDGTVTVAGSIGTSEVWGLGYAGGKTYAFIANGDISIISHSTGQTESMLSSNSETRWTGAATNPVAW